VTTITIGGEAVAADDPCALLLVLKGAYYRMLAGESRIEVRHGDTSVRRGVFATNLTELRAVIQQLEAECAAKQGKPRRHARGIRWC
jgi:hypothetical protein